MMVLSIIDKLNEWVNPFKTWIEDNHNRRIKQG